MSSLHNSLFVQSCSFWFVRTLSAILRALARHKSIFEITVIGQFILILILEKGGTYLLIKIEIPFKHLFNLFTLLWFSYLLKRQPCEPAIWQHGYVLLHGWLNTKQIPITFSISGTILPLDCLLDQKPIHILNSDNKDSQSYLHSPT